jgi:predicted HD superfamily hydrolase involved in NAD metabolism
VSDSSTQKGEDGRQREAQATRRALAAQSPTGDRELAERLIAERLSPQLRAHSRRVAETAAALVRRWGGEPEQIEDATVAGLLHDYCREDSAEEILAKAERYGLSVSELEASRPVELLHAPVAAAELADTGVAGRVLTAVALHTVGGPQMDLVAQAVYVADAIEPGRSFAGVDELRAAAEVSAARAVAACVRSGLGALIAAGKPLHPASVELYNTLYG